MKCEGCNAEIPENELREVNLGGRLVPYPFCVKCSEAWSKVIKDWDSVYKRIVPPKKRE